MLDIGFFELLVVAIVLIIVMGPERLPEVAKQAAFFMRQRPFLWTFCLR